MQIDRSLNYKLSNNVININNDVNKIDNFVLLTKHLLDNDYFYFYKLSNNAISINNFVLQIL